MRRFGMYLYWYGDGIGNWKFGAKRAGISRFAAELGADAPGISALRARHWAFGAKRAGIGDLKK